MTDTLPGSLGDLRGSTTTGVSLSTTAAYIPIPKATKYLSLTPRNFSTAVVARIGLCPWISVLKTQDAGVSITDYSDNAQDNDTSTDVTLSSQGTAAQGDFLYVGSHIPFRGVYIDVDSTNSSASVLTVKYRKSDDTWADITATDNTASGGASLAQDGTVTWTVPSTWVPSQLPTIGDLTSSLAGSGHKFYWTRWQFSAALDASTTLNSMTALPQSTSYAELVANQQMEQSIQFGPQGIAAIEALTDAGTANLVAIFGTANRRSF